MVDQFLLQVDLRDWWDWRLNISYVALEEKPTKDGRKVRNGMIAGAMFHGPYNESEVYTYGGTTFRGNESFPNNDTQVQYSEQYPLWSFDNATQVWTPFDTGQSWTPSYGAAAEAPDQGLAFYLNGRIDNGTAPSISNEGNDQTLLDGMMVIDIAQHTAINVSTTGMKNYQPRVGGGLQYVAGVGGKGVLVALGGQVFDGKRTVSSGDQGRLLSFDFVDVFDLASYSRDAKSNGTGTWYSQATSGDIPDPRIDFCVIMASAPDNSSHNVWLYGGRNPASANGTIYHDDVYILSLPTFTWIKVYQGVKPRWGHTCHLAGGNQMLTVGGHNEFESRCDWHTTGIGVLDLSRVVWGSVFQSSNDPNLNYKIVNVIGGSLSGNAPVRKPAKGWASDDLGVIMTTTRIYDNYGTIKTRSREAPRLDLKTRVATIAGSTIGGAILMGCVGWLAFLLWRRRTLPDASNIIVYPDVPEMDDMGKIELPTELKVFEVSALEGIHECPDSTVKVEADPDNAIPAAELPATNVGDRGRWGVPPITLLSASSPASVGARSWAAGDEGRFSTPRASSEVKV